MSDTINLRVASANLNQTIANFTQNVPNILAAIDKAAEDGADVLALQELGLTGYSGDDYFKWIRSESQQKELLEPSRRLTWSNSAHDITLQNIQARARQPYPWMFSNQEHKIACVTSNWSEAVAGYWTFGGDGHMGAINLCGGVPKSKLKRILRTLEQEGLEGMAPIAALNPVNVQIPTAELRPTAQSDEADMMPYKMLDAIGEAIFFAKQSPQEAYHSLQTLHDPEDESHLLFGKHDAPNKVDAQYLAECIEKACNMWHRSQFKRVGSVISPFLGGNVDPHTSVRTTIISDAFKNGVAQMKLEYLKDAAANDNALTASIGKNLNRATTLVLRDRGMRDELLQTRVSDLQAAIANDDFGKSTSPAVWVA